MLFLLVVLQLLVEFASFLLHALVDLFLHLFFHMDLLAREFFSHFKELILIEILQFINVLLWFFLYFLNFCVILAILTIWMTKKWDLAFKLLSFIVGLMSRWLVLVQSDKVIVVLLIHSAWRFDWIVWTLGWGLWNLLAISCVDVAFRVVQIIIVEGSEVLKFSCVVNT